MEKICIVDGCTEKCENGRRYCHRHYLDRRIELYNTRKESGLPTRKAIHRVCKICGMEYTVTNNRRLVNYCRDCTNKISNFCPSNVNGGSDYVYSKHEYSVSVLEHRCLATKVIGRKLSKNDIVHHINGNPKDNSLSNLLVLSNKNHVRLHMYINEQLCIRSYKEKLTMMEAWNKYSNLYTSKWIEDNKENCVRLNEVEYAEEKVKTSLAEYKTLKIKDVVKVKKDLPKKYYGVCDICGKELSRTQNRFCSYKCLNEWKIRNVPSKEELIEIIKSKTSLLQVAKHFNVRDNSVRKWLSKHNINIYDYGYRKLKNK